MVQRDTVTGDVLPLRVDLEDAEGEGSSSFTLAFTLGHSVTLATGSLGLPVPIGAVEALIAMSILIAAAHAVRPLSPPSRRSAGCWTGSGPPPRSQSSPTASVCCRSPWSSACGWTR